MPKEPKTEALHLKDKSGPSSPPEAQRDRAMLDRLETEDERAFPDRAPAQKKTGEF